MEGNETTEKEMLEHLSKLFEKKNATKNQDGGKETGDLQRKVGQLTMEMDFLEKKCKQLEIALSTPAQKQRGKARYSVI